MAARNRTMDSEAMRWLAILVLLLVPLAAVPLVGIWAVAVSGVGLVVVATVLLARFGRPRAPAVDNAGVRAGHPWWCSGWCPPAHSAPTCSRGGFQLRFHHLDPLSQSSAPMSTVSR